MTSTRSRPSSSATSAGRFRARSRNGKGLVEYANEGTLILDEVLNLPQNAQQLLLDFTQFGSYRPLGYQGRKPKRASLRVVSVTNGDMSQAILKGQFRQDLYYRLATVPVVLPALRDGVKTFQRSRCDTESHGCSRRLGAQPGRDRPAHLLRG